MINHLLLICSVIAIYEFLTFINFKHYIKSNLNIYKKIIKLFTYKKVSDLRKEKLIFNYSKSLFIYSMKIFAILISIFIFMFILNFLSNSFLNLVISISGIIEITSVFMIYHLLKRNIDAKL